MVKAPEPVARVSDGGAVKVNGPAFAPVAVLLTVTVPSFGFRFDGLVVNPLPWL